MEILDASIVTEFLKYGTLSMAFGFITIVPLELFVYGVMKVIAWFKL